MTCKYTPIKQYNSPPKQLITVNDKPFCIARSPKQASKILLYIEGLSDGSDIKDNKIIKMCDGLKVKV